MPSVISRIKQNKETILKAYLDKIPSTKKTKTSPYEEIHRMPFQWFTQQRIKNMPISSYILLQKANLFAQNTGFNDFVCNPS